MPNTYQSPEKNSAYTKFPKSRPKSRVSQRIGRFRASASDYASVHDVWESWGDVMLSQQITRVSSGLLAALVAATLLRFVFFDVGTLRTTADGTDTASLWTSLGVVLSYGLPPALLAVCLAEYVRVRSLTAHLALGIAVAIIAAYLATWGETLSSGAFSGGALARPVPDRDGHPVFAGLLGDRRAPRRMAR